MQSARALETIDLKPRMLVDADVTAAQLVTISPDGCASAHCVLTELERARLERLKSEPRKAELARSLVARRLWLAEHLNTAPEKVALKHNAAGLPLLEGFAPGEISFSRDAGWCAVALAKGCRVGIDIEIEREMNWSSVLGFLSRSDESDQIRMAVNSTGTLTPFFRAWCAKEAILKLTGKGLKAGPKNLRLPSAAIQGADAFEVAAPFGVAQVHVTKMEAMTIALATTML